MLSTLKVPHTILNVQIHAVLHEVCKVGNKVGEQPQRWKVASSHLASPGPISACLRQDASQRPKHFLQQEAER